MSAQSRADRALEQARAAEADEAARAQDRALEVARLQQVPPGLQLDLTPNDWLHMVSRHTNPRVKLRIASIHEPIMYRHGVGWVRVWAHGPGCGSLPAHAPCINVMARVGAILDAVPS